MRKGIHPQYHPTEIRCACGNVIETRSTKENLTVQICSSCHPFYTGKEKLLDAAGRIDRFAKKFSGKTVSAQKVAKKVAAPVLTKKEKEAAKEAAKAAAKEAAEKGEK